MSETDEYMRVFTNICEEYAVRGCDIPPDNIIQAARESMEGKVTYYDPYRDYKKFTVPHMAKHFGYSYQKEFRIAFRPRYPVSANLEPVYLSLVA